MKILCNISLSYLEKTYEVTDGCCVSKASHRWWSRTPAFLQDLGEHVSQWTWNIVWQKGNAAAFSDKNIFKNIRYSKMIVVIVVVVKHQAKPTGKEAGGCTLGCSDSTREATATLSIGMLVITGAAHHRIVWSGRDPKDPLVPTPLHWAGTHSTRLGCSKLHPT